MIYFKITDTEGNIIYGEINANREQIDFEKMKNFLQAQTLEEISKEEYDEIEEEVEE